MPESPRPSDGPATYVPPEYDPRAAAHLVPRPENAVHPMGIVLSARRARPVGRSIAGIVLIAALAVGGWVLFAPGSEGSNHSAGRPVASASPFPEPNRTPPTAGTGLGALLESIAIQDQDLPAGYRVKLAPGGDRVRGHVTLDNCGFRFTTEAHRVARRQYLFLDSSGRNTGVGNEVAAYDSAAQAAKAVAEWHQAAAHCPRGAVRSSQSGAPAVVERITRNELHLAGLPNATSALTVESAEAGGRRVYAITVLQVHGRILDAIYVVDTPRPTSRNVDNAIRLAGVAGGRLAALG